MIIDRELPLKAAQYIAVHGWTQGTMKSPGGAVCLTGVLRECSFQSGDWLIAREVYRCYERGEGWNDAGIRTEEEVAAYLHTGPIFDVDIENAFGPQWRQIVPLVRRTATFDSADRDRLRAVVGAVRDDAWRDAAEAAWVTARDADRTTVRNAARDAAGDAARFATGDVTGYADRDTTEDSAEGAVGALAIRDLIGQGSFSRAHYDTLTSAWRTVIGAIHLADPDSQS